MARLFSTKIVGYLLLGLLAFGEPARAFAEDRIGELTLTLAESHSERERIAAVTSLARIEDKAALRPLVVALQDPSAKVRAIAAIGLGKLHHKAAAPALRMTALGDLDPTVRERAAAALAEVNRANHLPTEPVTATVAVVAPTGVKVMNAATAPDRRVLIVLRGTSDESPGKGDPRARKVHADVLRATLLAEVNGSPLMTTDDVMAKKHGLETCQIDVSIVRLETRTDRGMIEVQAMLRLTISDERGKMLSFLSGGAAMQVKRRGYNLAYLPQLRKETVANAVRGLSAKLFEHLQRTVNS